MASASSANLTKEAIAHHLRGKTGSAQNVGVRADGRARHGHAWHAHSHRPPAAAGSPTARVRRESCRRLRGQGTTSRATVTSVHEEQKSHLLLLIATSPLPPESVASLEPGDLYPCASLPLSARRPTSTLSPSRIIFKAVVS